MTVETSYTDRLVMTDSQDRGPVLLEILGELTGDIRRGQVIIDQWWTSCDAWGEDLDRALRLLAWFAPVGDFLPEKTYMVYRATGGEEPDGGSWTLDLDVAERFAKGLCSLRARFLGYYSETPAVWCARVDSRDVIGYFNNRNEQELVLPHGVAQNVRKVFQWEPKLEVAEG